MISPKQTWRLLKATFAEWKEDKSSRLAAALAYYTVFSLAPLLMIVIVVASFIFGDDSKTVVIDQFQSLVGRQGAETIQTAIENTSKSQGGSTLASIFSIVALLFGASGVFTQLQGALNTVWEVEAKPGKGLWGFLRQRFLSFGMIIGICFILMVSLVVSAGLAGLNAYINSLAPGLGIIGQILNLAISFGVFTLLFAMIYKLLPDVKIAWKDVWVGSGITALLFAIGKLALGVYIGNSSVGSSYGAAGSVIVLLVWVYYSAQILFFGAEFTQVYARKYGSQIVPDQHAIPVTEEARAKQGMGNSRSNRKRPRSRRQQRPS